MDDTKAACSSTSFALTAVSNLSSKAFGVAKSRTCRCAIVTLTGGGTDADTDADDDDGDGDTAPLARRPSAVVAGVGPDPTGLNN